MTASQILSTVSSLLLWRSHQPKEWEVSIQKDGSVFVVCHPCGCASAIVDVDFPVDKEFRAKLDAGAQAELGRATANCVCNRRPFRLDLAGAGRDEPSPVVVPFVVECLNCDARHDDAFAARREGWTGVKDVQEDPGPDADFTHLGYCPECTRADVSGDRYEVA